MTRHSRRLTLATALALAALPATLVTAPPPAAAEPGRASLFVYGGYSLYSMGDVNDNIDSPSSFIGPITATADHVDGGWNAGGGLRVGTGTDSHLELGIAYLHAGTSGSGTMFGTAYTGDLDVSGIGITGSFGSFLTSRGRTRLGLGAGGGYYFCEGGVTVRSATLSGTTDLSGNGPGFHGTLLLDRPLGATLHLDAALGYRYARTTSVKSLGQDVLNEDGSKARIDWSGPFLRVGLAIHPRRSPSI